MVILLLWPLNFVISWFNAWACGKTWHSTKAKGGMAHFMNWMGAIMSASGFTWCYMVVLGFLGTIIPVGGDEAAGIEAAPLLTQDMLEAFFNLGYLMIIFPILGSGLAITVASWRRFARTRSVGDGLVTGWNTFAQIHNTWNAVQHVPKAWDGLGKFFKGGDDKKGAVVIGLVVLAVAGGCLTTYGIITSVSARALAEEGMKAQEQDLASAGGKRTSVAA